MRGTVQAAVCTHSTDLEPLLPFPTPAEQGRVLAGREREDFSPQGPDSQLLPGT